MARSLNVTATVYGADEQGEFVYGVFEPSDGAGESSSPVIKQLFSESAAASLSLKDQLIAEIPEDSIRGFASLAASLGYFVSQHKQVKRSRGARIGYTTLFRVFCGAGEPGVLSLPANEATLALLSRQLCETPGWVWLSEIAGAGVAEQQAINPRFVPGKVTMDLDGEARVVRPRTVFRGVAPGSGARFMLILQGSPQPEPPAALSSIASALFITKPTRRKWSCWRAVCCKRPTRSRIASCWSIAIFGPCDRAFPSASGKT